MTLIRNKLLDTHFIILDGIDFIVCTSAISRQQSNHLGKYKHKCAHKYTYHHEALKMS